MEVIRALLFSCFVVVLVYVGVHISDLEASFIGWKVSEKIAFGSFLALVITAGIVWWYTKEAQRSNDISQQPVLNLYLRKGERGAPWKFALRNVGHGPAYNIRISPIPADEYVYEPSLQEPNFILEAGGDEKEFGFKMRSPDGRRAFGGWPSNAVEQMMRRIFSPDEGWENKGVFLINYRGMSGQSYYSVFRLCVRDILLKVPEYAAIEFIENNFGECTQEEAEQLCLNKPLDFIKGP